MTLKKAVLITGAIHSVTMTAPALAADETLAPIAIPAPPAGKGQIVFFRSGAMGMALGCSVNENGQKVSSLGNGKYFIMVADPGRHEFSVKSEAKDVLALEVEPDETQFASCRIKMGVMVGRPDIRPATEEEFRSHPKLKMVDVDDMGPGPGALRPEEVAAALAVVSPPPSAPSQVASPPVEPTEVASPAVEPTEGASPPAKDPQPTVDAEVPPAGDV